MQCGQIRDILRELNISFMDFARTSSNVRILLSCENPAQRGDRFLIDAEYGPSRTRFEALCDRAGQIVRAWEPSCCPPAIYACEVDRWLFFQCIRHLASANVSISVVDGVPIAGTIVQAEIGAMTVLERLLALAERELITMPTDLLSHADAADVAECDKRTIQRWIASAKLPSYGPGKRVSESELRRLLPVLRQRKRRSNRQSAKKTRSVRDTLTTQGASSTT